MLTGGSADEGFYLDSVSRRAFLGALYWAYQQSLRGRDQASLAPGQVGFDESMLAERFHLPGVILLGDGHTRFGRAGDGPPSLTTRFESAVWGPHTDPLNRQGEAPELQEWFGWALWARGWIELHRRSSAGRSAWNGSLARLVRVTQGDDENSHELQMQPTTYVAQMATTFAWKVWKQWAYEAEGRERRREMIAELGVMVDRRLQRIDDLDAAAGNPDLDPERRAAATREAVRLRRDIADIKEAAARLADRTFPDMGLQVVARHRRKDLDAAFAHHELHLSRLANALSTNVAIVSKDGWFYLQRRNAAQVGEGLVDWQTTGAGFVDLERDVDGVGHPAVWRTMGREAREEFGWELWAPALGVFWEGRKREVGILALARSENASTDIRVPIVETTEVLGFRPMPFDARTIFSFICAERVSLAPAGEGWLDAGAAPRLDGTDPITGPWANVMPLGAASIIFALAHDSGGTPEGWVQLAQEFESLRRNAR